MGGLLCSDVKEELGKARAVGAGRFGSSINRVRAYFFGSAAISCYYIGRKEYAHEHIYTP